MYKNPILNSKTNLQVLEHFHWKHSGLEFSFAGGKNEKSWNQSSWEGWRFAIFMFWDECFCSVYMHLAQLFPCARSICMLTKRNVDHVNSQLSQPLKCLRACVTNARRCLSLVSGQPPLLRNNYCILTSLLTWNSRAALILITYDIIVLIK